jgi:hypothetical protein
MNDQGQINVIDILTGGQATRTEQSLQRMQLMATVSTIAAVGALGLVAWFVLTQARR